MSGYCKNCGNQHCICGMPEDKCFYHLIWMIEQYCGFEIDDNEPRKTRYNADAYAVMYLVENGYAEIVGDKKFTETKFMDFVWTDKAKEIMSANK